MRNYNHPPKKTGREPDKGFGKDKQSRTGAAERRKKKIGARITVTILGILAALLVGFTAYTYGYSNIHHGMHAGTISIGGMDKASAARAIDRGCATLLSGQSISLTIYDKTYAILISDVTNGMDSEITAERAYAYTHEGNFFTRMGHVFSATVLRHEIPLSALVEEEALNARLDEISAEALRQPVGPSWKLDGNQLIIDRGMPGVDFDRQEVGAAVTERIQRMNFEPYKVGVHSVPQKGLDLEEIKAAIDTDPQNAKVDKTDGVTVLDAVDGVEMDLASAQKELEAADPNAQTVTITVKRIPAEVDAAKLKQVLFRDTLSTASTNFRTSNVARANNVKLASSFIDGVILNPGEEFSYNDVVGERTTKRGFRPAGAYVAGELVDEVGGGVCQPSSTLYMAVLRADLEVTERTNHGLTVAYTPLGEDATVSYGAIDFRFRNDTGYPVKMIANSSGGTLSMSIVGTKTSDKKVSVESKVIATYPPQTVEKPDPTLETGKTQIKQKGQTGYKVETYKIITQNGKTTRVKIHTSTYRKKDQIILVGTKPVSATKPEKPTQPSQSEQDKQPIQKTDEKPQQEHAVDPE